MFEPLDFMARLVALAPTPRVNLTRYHHIWWSESVGSPENDFLNQQISVGEHAWRQAI